MPATQLGLIALAGFGAGAVNALAGGGTLISFPALLAAGLAPISANISSTLALCPGYLGAALAQRRELRGQRARLAPLLLVALAGGLLGAVLLLGTAERAFARAVPWLILLACALLAAQDRLRRLLLSRRGMVAAGAAAPGRQPAARRWPVVLIAAGAVYGGYFGAGMSVVLLAALGLACDDELDRLNAYKQTLALAANASAALWLGLHARPDWPVIGVLATGAALGGVAGGRFAARLPARALRRVVVLMGVTIAVIYLWRAR